MKQYLQYVDYTFWVAIIALECVISFLAVSRGLVRHLPRFVIYSIFVSLRSLSLFAVSQAFSYRVYFWSFYAGIAIEVILLFLVVYEIFGAAFSPLDSIPREAVPTIATIFCVLLSATMAWGIWNPASRPKFPWGADLLNTLDRSAGIVIACALWTVVMYARHIGVPWRSRVAGIARGFLVNLSIQAITVSVIGFTSPAAGMWFSRIGMLGNIAALLIWTRAVRQQEIPVVLPAPESLARLQVVVAQMRAGVGRLRKAPPAPGLSTSQD